jgi:hypothetical protein
MGYVADRQLILANIEVSSLIFRNGWTSVQRHLEWITGQLVANPNNNSTLLVERVTSLFFL